ncbi:hypothetical protein [Neisseria polysaccharea]|uniref:hypothetical protein n=1 Tax=Neisseria polysaccharea TaxID=489 RepID=UPI0011125FB8
MRIHVQILLIQKSSKQFGHTFTQHGAQKKNNLKGRAASTRQEQGYWTNNNDAAQFLSPYRNIDKVTTAPIPDGLGEVVLPDGSVKKANCAIIVPDKKPPKGNCLKTAYPIYSKNGC